MTRQALELDAIAQDMLAVARSASRPSMRTSPGARERRFKSPYGLAHKLGVRSKGRIAPGVFVRGDTVYFCASGSAQAKREQVGRGLAQWGLRQAGITESPRARALLAVALLYSSALRRRA